MAPIDRTEAEGGAETKTATYQTGIVMPFLLRKDYPGDRSQYVAVLPGYENHIGPESVTFDPDKTRATPFLTWQEAELRGKSWMHASGPWLSLRPSEFGPAIQIETRPDRSLPCHEPVYKIQIAGKLVWIAAPLIWPPPSGQSSK
jgi:hypothetical protein